LILRDYQKQAVEKLWARLFESGSALCVIATGGGKTEIMQALLQKCFAKKPDLKVVVIAQKINLIEQTARRFRKNFDSVSIYCGSIEKDLSGSIVIASIQSIAEIKMHINIVVVDEVHAIDHEQGRYFDFFELNRHEKMKVIGFTATPFRADGPIYGEGKFFEKIDFIKPMDELIDEGYLVRPLMKAPNHQIDTSQLSVRAGEYAQEDVERVTVDQSVVDLQVKDALSRLANRYSVVWACASIAHAEMVSSTINRIIEGQDNVSIIHSKMGKQDRANHLGAFEELGGHLVFVTIVSEGYDHPPIDAVVLMRPTRSPVLYVQMVGRGLRTSEGKKDCLVLDYGNVVRSCGPINNPKVVTARKGKKPEEEIQHRVCPECFEYVLKILPACDVCGHVFYTKKETKLRVESDVQDILAKPKPREMLVKKVVLGFHTSKAGNDCLMVIYKPLSMLDRDHVEYFTFSNDWAYKRMVKRLQELDCPIVGDTHEQAEQLCKRCPKSIILVSKNGYNNIERLVFE